MVFGRLICKLLGHQWRRLTVKERIAAAERTQPIGLNVDAAYIHTMRRCRRCSAERVVRARKPKQETTT